MRFIISVVIVLACLANPLKAQESPDLLGAALDSIGFTRADLGIEPKGYWTRFPSGIPYKLKAFDDLFAEPLKLFDYGKSFAGAVRTYCDSQALRDNHDNLYNLTYFLGVERRSGEFRSYGANLAEMPETGISLYQAVQDLYLAGKSQTEYYTFGKKADWPDVWADMDSLLDEIPEELESTLALLIEHLRDAIHWRNLALRDVPFELQHKIFYLRDLADSQGDGTVYHPEMDDAAGAIDWESLYYAALKVSAAVELAHASGAQYCSSVPRDLMIDIPTPFGRIVIAGTGNDDIDGDDCLLIVDCGGDDTYTGSAGATSRPGHGVSVVLDFDGNDSYKSESMNPSFGAGLFGVGVLFDAAGSDRYEGRLFTQGAGLFGVGILFDQEGIDQYEAETSAQGSAYFGIGLLIDANGHDTYYLYGDGQGFGGIGGGVGCLADYSGDDSYTAEPSADVVNRGDYHSEYAINVNSAQGAGMGRRGDGSDGHSWAGGLGAIIDISGNDTYTSGNWTLGCGYWFGTGIAYDGSGDDTYNSVYFTQGSGAHFCNGILIDEGGNDTHILTETAGAAFGFGWDYTNALFIDRGGDDKYSAKMISFGLAQIRSFGFFFDLGGADTYTYKADQQGMGAATFRDNYATPAEMLTYYYYSKSAGIFIDAAGTDQYLVGKNDRSVQADRWKNNAVWFSPDKSDSTYGFNNYGIGIDADSGRIPELEIFDTALKEKKEN